MALTITVTKEEVEGGNGLFSIILNLTCMDSAVEVINQDFTIQFRPGNDVDAKVRAVGDDMQQAIDDYNSEKAIFTAAQLDDAVIWLNGNLVG